MRRFNIRLYDRDSKMTLSQILPLLLLQIYLFPCSADVKCPLRCSCNQQLTIVRCMNLDLQQIPKGIPESVEKLHLQNNLLTSIDKDSLSHLIHLEYLDFSNNYIDSIHEKAFVKLQKLSKLLLASNRLRSIPAATALMTSLEQLTLSSNKISNATFPDGYLKLKKISLAQNNELRLLTEDSFKTLRNSPVTTLYLSSCQISHIANGTFHFLPYLVSLRLSYNPINNSQLAAAMSGLNSTRLSSIKLAGLKLDGVFPTGVFKELNISSIQDLDLSHNVVRVIKVGTFDGHVRLRRLVLRSCLINTIEQNVFMVTSNLELLTLRNNSLVEIPGTLPGTLKSLDLGWNINIRALKNNAFLNVKKLQSLYLNHNLLLHLEQMTFAGLHKLTTLDLSENQLSYIPKELFHPLRNLRFLKLASNNLKQLKTAMPPLFSKLKKLVHLDLSNNYCNKLQADIFYGLSNIQTLLLQSNHLGLIMSKESLLFKNLHKLEELHLENNVICHIHSILFRDLKHIKRIHLRNNRLSHWSGKLFDGTDTLQMLDLSANAISLINSTSMHHLQSLQSLNLTTNPFACTCDLLWFRQWINNTNVTLVGLETYKCASPQSVQNLPLLQWHPEPEDCINFMPYITGGAVICTVVLLCVVFILSYRYRWFLRLRLYKLTHVVNVNHQPGYEAVPGNDGIDYDCFISFCDVDRFWVSEVLLPLTEPEFKMCYDERDFEPNRPTVGCIYEGIEASRKFLIILSCSYKQASRCEMELYCALQKMTEDDHFDILIVQKDDVQASHIPSPLRHFIQDPTGRNVLQWEDGNANAKELFVRRLSDKLRQQARTDIM